jgi:hypothetical protein
VRDDEGRRTRRPQRRAHLALGGPASRVAHRGLAS